MGYVVTGEGGFEVSVGSPGGDYSDILFYWGMESTTAEHHDGADGTATLNGSAIETTQHAVGSNSLTCTQAGSTPANGEFVLSGNCHPTEGTIGIYFYLTASTANDTSLAAFSYSIPEDYFMISSWGGSLYVRWAGNSTNTDLSHAASLSTGQWYFVQAWYSRTAAIDGTKTLKVRVWNQAGTEQGSATSSTSALTAMTSAPTALYAGNALSIANSIYVDQMFCSNSLTRDLSAIRNATDAY